MEQKLRAPDMLLDIMSMRNRAMELLAEGNSYNTLLHAITAKDFYGDESLRIPSMKELAEQAGLKYEQARKQLQQIYDDLIPSLERSLPFHFKKVLYFFRLKAGQKFIWFEADQLPIVPRVGENVEVDFFKAYVGTRNFYVSEIRHSLENDLQIVYIDLVSGWYNSFWHYRKDQARLEGQISLEEYYSHDDATLKNKLNIGNRRHYW